MFDILYYLFENYFTPQACPDTSTLMRKLAAAGFEDDDIDEALDWLRGLAESTRQCVDLPLSDSSGIRVYAEREIKMLGIEAIGFIAFLESSGVLPGSLREVVIERALALDESPVSVESLKIIVLMVLWSQSADIDNLILEELLDDGSARQVH